MFTDTQRSFLERSWNEPEFICVFVINEYNYNFKKMKIYLW